MIKFRKLYQFCQFQDIQVISTLKSRISGTSKKPEYELYRTYHNKTIEEIDNIPGVTLVRDKNDARRVIDILYKYTNRTCAWDTETIDIDVKNETPIGRGRLICASAFAGPEVNFGNGPRLFIDNFAQNSDLILEFKEYFESDQMQKSWHHYGFDRHIINNHGINVRGFHSDTMHMARLLNPSGQMQDYSLSNLSKQYEEELESFKNQLIQQLSQRDLNDEERRALDYYQNHLKQDNLKINMKNIFGESKQLKNGEMSKIKVFPTIVQMHCLPKYIHKWIQYSTLDAEITYFLEMFLKCKLKRQFLNSDKTVNFFGMKTLGDIYKVYWSPLGELLTEMERAGMKVDLEHVKSIKQQAEDDMKKFEQNFKEWVQSTQETDVEQFNCNSTQQLQQLLFAPCDRIVKKQSQKEVVETLEEESDGELSDGRKKSIRKEVTNLPEVKGFVVPNIKGVIEEGRNIPLKNMDMKIKGLGIKPIGYTPSGLPSADYPTIKQLVGKVDTQNYGLIYDHYAEKGQQEEGIKACLALNNLIELRSIEVLLNTFIIPLLELTDKSTSRIHSSININTETGRLSARNPNLLNQPAFEKDRYKIRKSFIADKGKKLIVADYGQLELRVLAHMTKCKTMIDAFLKGGDFHSRTLITMYPNIQKEIDDGKVLLEWDKSKGEAHAPLVKDKYAGERRKAKVLNFSIAYGKSAIGFASDWKCEVKEAQETIDKWFAQRQEVKQWQARMQQIARECKYSQTLLGRFRYLDKLVTKKMVVARDGKSEMKPSLSSHGLRASINTPIQGGAADIVIAAMIKIYKNEELKRLGYRLLLQVHDELILEGPEENSQDALKIVRHEMEHPFDRELELPLEIDAKIGNNWYECK